MPRPRSVIALLALVALLAAAACRPAESERATAAVDSFLRALERGDGSAACEDLSEAGVSELLFVALEHRVAIPPAGRPDSCTRIAERLPRAGIAALRRAPVRRVIVDGPRATIETEAGAYEAEEQDGRWRVARFDPVATLVGGDPPPTRPVGLTIARPEFDRPALGPSVAGETVDEEIELTGTLEPEGARLQIRALEGGDVDQVTAADGRFRARLRLREGENLFRVTARAPGREPTQLGIRMRRN